MIRFLTSLYGLSLVANSAKLALSMDVSDIKMQGVSRCLNYLIYGMNTAMVEMKWLVFELRPKSLQSEGWVMALYEVGLEITEKFPGHLGLHSMREHAKTIGTEFLLFSAPGKMDY